MDSSLTIRIATDMERVKAIMTDPHIWDRASNESANRSAFYPNHTSSCIWLEIVADDVIGVILLHMENDITAQFHPYMLKGNEKFSRDMFYKLYKWLLENLSDDINKINVAIPSFDRKLYNLVKKVGFTEEGINRESYRKNGEIFDYINFGMTVSEMKEIADEQTN